jgi:hypothetical protein
MKTFKKFIEEMGVGGVPANNIAGSGADSIAKYDPMLKGKMFRRKKLKKEKA